MIDMKVAVVLLNVVFIGWILRRIMKWLRRPRLFVVNFDGFFVNKPTGKVASKCMKLAWRCLFLMEEGDAIIVAHAVPTTFIDYFEKVRGFRPIIYTIAHVCMPLDIVSSVMQDSALMERLLADIKKGRWVIQPLISTIEVFELAVKLGIPVSGTPKHLVGREENLVRKLNSKVVFAQWCEKMGYTTAGRPCYSREQVRNAADRLIRHGQTAVIREHISAGGLGNGCYTSVKDVDTMLAGIPSEPGFAAMVGSYLDLPHHVSVLFRVSGVGTQIISSCDRRLKDRTESVGGTTPCPDMPGLKEAKRIARKYGRQLHKLGYRGIADIDFAFSEDGRTIILFESNARLVLTSVPINIAKHFEELWGTRLHPVIVDYSEDAPICAGVQLEDLGRICELAVAGVKRSARNPKRLALVIVSPPDPDSGWYSFAAAAQHREDAAALRTAFIERMGSIALEIVREQRPGQRGVLN